MKAPPKPALAILALALAGAAWFGYTRFVRSAGPPMVQGWIEAQLLFIGPDESGRVEALAVREGDKVAIGAPIFTLDSDLQKATLAEAEAALANAQITFQRAKELLARNVGSQKVFDDAEAFLRTAEARLNSARTRLQRRGLASPVAGSVQEVYFRAGELVPAGRPIVSVLPPGNVRVRFFVAQEFVPRLKIGDRVEVTCDGCAAGLSARISFISAQAEFTPPVIYSQEERARLVFRIEALPEAPDLVRVGQPVSVTLPFAGKVSSKADAR